MNEEVELADEDDDVYEICDLNEDPFKLKGIEYITQPTHFSPSSYKEWRTCPYKFYLSRLSPDSPTLKRRRIYGASRPAAVGTGFDAFAKAWADSMEAKPGDLPPNPYQLVNRGSTAEKYREEAIRAGQKLLEIYLSTAAPYLCSDRPFFTDFRDTVVVEGVPLKGELDLTLGSGQVVDWKTRGYASAPKSPTPGWIRKWKGGKITTSPHKRSKDYFELINEDWASQLTIYAFIRGHRIGDPLIVAIDELSMRNVWSPETINKNTVCVTQIRSKVSEEFQVNLMKGLQEAWDDVTNMRVPAPMPSARLCHRFKRMCGAAEFCNPYLQWSSMISVDFFRRNEAYQKVQDLARHISKW